MRLVDADNLYEKACDLEAQALSYVGKIGNDESKIEEWKIWSAILTERTAFKHDVYDAPTVTPAARQRGKWIEQAGAVGYECSVCHKWLDVFQGSADMNFCPHCGADMREDEER